MSYLPSAHQMRQHRGMTDLEAIADRYYCHLLEGQPDWLGYHAALDLYLERNPGTPEADARSIVPKLIHEASGAGLMWPLERGWRGGAF